MNSKTWNSDLKKSQKHRLLMEAGHSVNLKYRTYEFLPSNVKADLDYIETRKQVLPVALQARAHC